MSFWLTMVLLALAGYFLGSISVGMIIAKLSGVDIRKKGSGNIGATNVFRTVGKTHGAVVLIGDALKGILAALLGRYILGTEGMLLAGFASIMGHNYSFLLKGKGGKGIATSLGVVLVCLPWTLLVALPLFVITLLVTGYVSVGSITAALSVIFSCWFFYKGNSNFNLLMLFSIAAVVLAIWRHKPNIEKLLRGEEHGFKKRKSGKENNNV